MLSAVILFATVLLSATLLAVTYSIIHGLLFQEPEAPTTGATRSRAIQH